MTASTEVGRTPAVEHVVLLDEAGHAVGTAPKATVHHQSTPLHLAFSCYLFDGEGSLLLTRRALGKPTWPGVWTNSVCGHPLPGEDLRDAVARRVLDEVGARVAGLSLVLPAFRYEAEMSNGVRENEMCPVFVATTVAADVRPSPEEVDAATWVRWDDFRDSVLDGSREVSPWCREQVALLAEREGAPCRFAAADAALLPPAARSQ